MNAMGKTAQSFYEEYSRPPFDVKRNNRGLKKYLKYIKFANRHDNDWNFLKYWGYRRR